MLRALYLDASQHRGEWLRMSVPALLYTVQNNCLYIGFLHLEAAVGQVTYQSKILFTAFFSVLMLGKTLKAPQWLALLLLAAGVCCTVAPQGLERLADGVKDSSDDIASGESAESSNPKLGASPADIASGESAESSHPKPCASPADISSGESGESSNPEPCASRATSSPSYESHESYESILRQAHLRMNPVNPSCGRLTFL